MVHREINELIAMNEDQTEYGNEEDRADYIGKLFSTFHIRESMDEGDSCDKQTRARE